MEEQIAAMNQAEQQPKVTIHPYFIDDAHSKVSKALSMHELADEDLPDVGSGHGTYMSMSTYQRTQQDSPPAPNGPPESQREGPSRQVQELYLSKISPMWARIRSCMAKGASKFERGTRGKAVLLETFPNSGTSITQFMGHHLVGWDNMATVYPEEFPQGQGKGAEGAANHIFVNKQSTFGKPTSGKLLIKTHCQKYGFCQDPDVKAPNTTFHQCLLRDTSDFEFSMQSDLDKDLIAGVLQVVRNPLDNLIARLNVEIKENRINFTFADLEDNFDSVLFDVQVHMKWLARARARVSEQLTEVMWYEDLQDPNKFASEVARVLGVADADRKDTAVNWADIVLHRHNLIFHGSEQLPVYLDMYTPSMINKLHSVMDDEMRTWTNC
jgi:hypothetical protein